MARAKLIVRIPNTDFVIFIMDVSNSSGSQHVLFPSPQASSLTGIGHSSPATAQTFTTLHFLHPLPKECKRNPQKVVVRGSGVFHVAVLRPAARQQGPRNAP